MTSQPTKDPKTILAANIRAAREEKRWTQRELAERVNGVDTPAVSRWERGLVIPNGPNLQALASALEYEVGWFFTDHDEQRVTA